MLFLCYLLEILNASNCNFKKFLIILFYFEVLNFLKVFYALHNQKNPFMYLQKSDLYIKFSQQPYLE